MRPKLAIDCLAARIVASRLVGVLRIPYGYKWQRDATRPAEHSVFRVVEKCCLQCGGVLGSTFWCSTAGKTFSAVERIMSLQRTCAEPGAQLQLKQSRASKAIELWFCNAKARGQSMAKPMTANTSFVHLCSSPFTPRLTDAGHAREVLCP